jgi:EAL domain-containing protein (putative c-di-GMP-specific phosphodiesterase class I)
MNDEPFELATRDLERAIAEDQLQLFYQPQVTADGQGVSAVEALVRWRHPEAGWVPPCVIIPYAERTGLIETLGLWVLKRACRDAHLWPDVTVSVNVSPTQFRNPDFARRVTDCLDACGLQPGRIELEITEGAVFADAARAEVAMRQLRDAGIALALDDFGTGYSSLSYLRSLPWDKVKIDKSFVDNVGFITSAAIVHATVALARAIGLKVTAEGVETPEQQKFLKLAGCHYLQGYLFSRPIPARDFTQLLAAWRSYPKRASG